MLLSLYLTLPPPHVPNLPPALDLVFKHGSRLPASSTLSLIPNDLPVSSLESYSRGRIRAANSTPNLSRVAEGLGKARLVDTQALLLFSDSVPSSQSGRNLRVFVGEERVYGVSHNRLGNSVVAVLPDNGVVRYRYLGKSSGGGAYATKGVAGSWGRNS
jgi:hypothetical protein